MPCRRCLRLYQQALEQLTSTAGPDAPVAAFRTASAHGDWLYPAAFCVCALRQRRCNPRNVPSALLSAVSCAPVAVLGAQGTFTVSPASLVYLRHAMTAVGAEPAAMVVA